MFPGQGSQYVGMGKRLSDTFKVASQTFQEANEILGYDLQAICFEGKGEQLTKTEFAQPAILTASVAAYRVYEQEIGVQPAFGAGHSLGEFSALTCAGAISFRDALQLVRLRGQYMTEVSEGTMSAIIGISAHEVQRVCNEVSTDSNIVIIANYNSRDQIVISGHHNAVEKAGGILKSIGATVIALNVSGAFHSPLMQDAAIRFQEKLEGIQYQELRWPVISNVTALPYPSPSHIRTLLIEQMVKPVLWEKTVSFLEENGVNVALEIGPKTVLKNLVHSNRSKISAFSYDKEEDVTPYLAHINEPPIVNKPKGDPNSTVVIKCIAAAVCTKNRNHNLEEYQAGVVQPYRNIQRMQETIEREGRMPSVEEMRLALDMLLTVCRVKKVPLAEQLERFNEIMDDTDTRAIFSDYIRAISENLDSDEMVV